MTPLSVWHRREQILPSHSTRVKTNICANRHGQEHIFGTIIQALQSMSAESVTDVIIFYWITETQISFFFTSPVKVKCSCTFRKNFQITFVFVVQGRYARIYYLDSISLIPNWGERRKPRMQSISCWAQLSFSFVSKQPSKVQDKKTRGNYSTEKICEGKLKAELTMFYICQVPRVHVLLSPPVSSFAFLSTAGVR